MNNVVWRFTTLHIYRHTNVTHYLTTFVFFYGCTEHSIRILFGPNSRPNSVFVFGRIVMQKIHRIRITVAVRLPLACSSMKPRMQTLPWARYYRQLLFVCLLTGETAARRCLVGLVIRRQQRGPVAGAFPASHPLLLSWIHTMCQEYAHWPVSKSDMVTHYQIDAAEIEQTCRYVGISVDCNPRLLHLSHGNYSYSILIRPNSNGNYSLFGRILEITIWYSPSFFHISPKSDQTNLMPLIFWSTTVLFLGSNEFDCCCGCGCRFGGPTVWWTDLAAQRLPETSAPRSFVACSVEPEWTESRNSRNLMKV